MAGDTKTVLIYERDAQTAGTIEFAARQFDLKPVKTASLQEARQRLHEQAFDVVFAAADFPFSDVPQNTVVIPIFDKDTLKDEFLTGARYCTILHKPVSVSDVAAVIHTVLHPGSERERDYVYQILRSRMLLRHLQYLIGLLQTDPATQITLREGIYAYCVERCPLAVSGDPRAESGGTTYHLLTVSVQHGKRSCALYEECRLHRFSVWLEKEHPDAFQRMPSVSFRQDKETPQPEGMQEVVQRLIEQQDAAVARLYELKKIFCSGCCDIARSGTDFKEDNVLLSEWVDMFRNQCLYCPQPDCPLNLFFALLVYRLKTV